MAGTLTISTLSDGTNSTSSTNCIQGSAKAWVRFNGVPATPTISASYNVGSVTKNGTGDYTVNMTTAMPDANYATQFSAERAGGRVPLLQSTTYSTTAVRLNIVDVVANALNGDASICCVSVFR